MQGKFSILFLCTWNASRSIFAEYFMKEFGAAKFDAFSAGVTPRGEVSPVTLKILKERYRLDASEARSKSWHEFQEKELDFIVSVSDQAEETAQGFPRKPVLAHWPFPDPSQVQGSAEEIEDAYFQVASRIRYRLQLFNNLSFDKLDRLRLELKMIEFRGAERPASAGPGIAE
jgi:arsenate reductase